MEKAKKATILNFESNVSYRKAQHIVGKRAACEGMSHCRVGRSPPRNDIRPELLGPKLSLSGYLWPPGSNFPTPTSFIVSPRIEGKQQKNEWIMYHKLVAQFLLRPAPSAEVPHAAAAYLNVAAAAGGIERGA
jgi:hypothetical protein